MRNFKHFAIVAGMAVLALLSVKPMVVSAQTVPYVVTYPNGKQIDTASQAAAEGAKVQFISASRVLSLEVITLKISGTIAGTITWQGSNTGVSTEFADISTTTLVDSSKSYSYKEVDKGYIFYRALITQTGTSSLSYRVVPYNSPYSK